MAVHKMMAEWLPSRKIVILFLGLVVLFSTTSCLQERGKKEVSVSVPSWFEGVKEVKNLGGNPASVKITWNAAEVPVTAYRVYSLIYNTETKLNEWSQIDEVTSDQFSYVHSELSSGQVYTYMVRAVNSSEVEDVNSKQLATVAFEGISSVRVTGANTATVSLNNGTGAFDEVRVYAQPVRAGSGKVLIKAIKGNVTSIDVTNLNSGVKYKFFVNAYMSYLAGEDGNEIYVEGKTNSETFGSGSNNDTNYSYRGVMAVQAFGDAPNAPKDPKARMVKLVWNPFNGASSSTKYRVIRSSTAYTPDLTTALTCSSSMAQSCIVSCTNTGTGTQTCDDINVASPPMTYNYVITQVKKNSSTNEEWVEELPDSNANEFYVKVAIPSDYMVLVQRDAANFEMCKMLGQTSNPRKNQRCSYTGIAASPYNSGPNKAALNFDSGYYDFGYNLFVDRYRLACNWTRVSPSCGPNGCIGVTGNSSTAGAPDNSLGQPGDVYFALNPFYGANCYYKNGTSWISTAALTTADQFRVVARIDPGEDGKRHYPQLNGFGQAQAYNFCSNQSSAYGNKRLMRRREYVHASAFATLPGEPNAVFDEVAEYNLREGIYSSALVTGGQLPGYRRCASGSAASMLTLPTTVADVVAPTNYRSQMFTAYTPGILNYMNSPYFIGTPATENCVSRWGAQDPISHTSFDGNNTVMADTFVRTNIGTNPPVFSPVASDSDSGVIYDWGNYQFDGVTSGLTQYDSATFFKSTAINSTTMTTLPKYILTMGLALINSSFSAYRNSSDLIYNGTLGPSAFNGGSNATLTHVYDATTARYTMMEGTKNRFSYTIHPDISSTRIKVWCAVEAE
ncbi:MAG: fibronectin type III domain-containing protein [Bdellovibrionaceae bacterium]|nr:fibronectin type III domain-containing protein [Pseudobdellovibrionaceae bacterium]